MTKGTGWEALRYVGMPSSSLVRLAWQPECCPWYQYASEGLTLENSRCSKGGGAGRGENDDDDGRVDGSSLCDCERSTRV